MLTPTGAGTHPTGWRMGTKRMPVEAYSYTSAHLLPHDPRAARAAEWVASAVRERDPAMLVEHVGSTAVPGLAGKGIVDLMLVYPDGRLTEARDLVDSLGFQPQTFGNPFPEARPMRVGVVRAGGSAFRVHVHVLAASSPEVTALRRFRDRLREDPGLREGYARRKQHLIEAGITESPDYSERKGDFIGAVLRGERPLE